MERAASEDTFLEELKQGIVKFDKKSYFRKTFFLNCSLESYFEKDGCYYH
jgi:hypothetical protein